MKTFDFKNIDANKRDIESEAASHGAHADVYSDLIVLTIDWGTKKNRDFITPRQVDTIDDVKKLIALSTEKMKSELVRFSNY